MCCEQAEAEHFSEKLDEEQTSSPPKIPLRISNQGKRKITNSALTSKNKYYT